MIILFWLGIYEIFKFVYFYTQEFFLKFENNEYKKPENIQEDNEEWDNIDHR